MRLKMDCVYLHFELDAHRRKKSFDEYQHCLECTLGIERLNPVFQDITIKIKFRLSSNPIDFQVSFRCTYIQYGNVCQAIQFWKCS